MSARSEHIQKAFSEDQKINNVTCLWRIKIQYFSLLFGFCSLSVSSVFLVGVQGLSYWKDGGASLKTSESESLGFLSSCYLSGQGLSGGLPVSTQSDVDSASLSCAPCEISVYNMSLSQLRVRPTCLCHCLTGDQPVYRCISPTIDFVFCLGSLCFVSETTVTAVDGAKMGFL